MRQNSSAGEPVAMSSDQSQMSPSSENSAVPRDDLQATRQKKVSLEPSDVLENGKSAFQITSVSELEPSTITSGANADSKSFIDIRTATDTIESALESSTELKPAEEQAYSSDAGSAHPSQPAAGCSRFRRVNEYVRGRWSVRDITETVRDMTEVEDSGSGVDALTPPDFPAHGNPVTSDSRVVDLNKSAPLPRDTMKALDANGDTSAESHTLTPHLFGSVSHPALLHSQGTSTPDSVADGVDLSGGKQKDLQNALFLIQTSLSDYSSLADIKTENERLRKENQDLKTDLEQLRKDYEAVKRDNKNLHVKLQVYERPPGFS